MGFWSRSRTRVALTLGAVALAASGCGFTGLYGAPLPGGADLGDHPFTVTICFANVLDLVPQSTVKVNDVEVGRVEKVELTKSGDSCVDKSQDGWTAKVQVQVNDSVHLPSNARAEVRITSLLGEKYVDLEQPTDKPASTPLKDGSVISITHTGSAPEVEQVLGALSLLLNGGGLPQIKTITTELDKALSGNESAIRDLLGQLNGFIGTLDNQKDTIFTALDSIDRLTHTLNANKKVIEQTLDTMPQALEILKNERNQFVDLLTSLANLGTVATHVITATQQNLTDALKSLAPSLEQLIASGSDLPQALKIGGTFPFPLGTTLQAVKGDYANLHAYVDLSLTDELCGLSDQLCKLAGKLPKLPLLTQPKSAQSIDPDAPSYPALQPTLIGAGG